jgi:hypothetical protein
MRRPLRRYFPVQPSGGAAATLGLPATTIHCIVGGRDREGRSGFGRRRGPWRGPWGCGSWRGLRGCGPWGCGLCWGCGPGGCCLLRSGLTRRRLRGRLFRRRALLLGGGRCLLRLARPARLARLFGLLRLRLCLLRLLRHYRLPIGCGSVLGITRYLHAHIATTICRPWR